MGTVYERLVGQRFRLFVVVSLRQVRYGAKQRTTFKALCRCDCGNEKEVFVNALTQGRTGSCGCDKSRYASSTGERNYLFKGYREIRSAFWNGYREGAQRRGIEFKLTMKYAWDLYEQQGRRCALSGVPIEFGPNRKNALTSASLDRLDHNAGYVEGNVQWVHKKVNLMRNVLSVDEFLGWCRLVAENAEPSIRSTGT